MIIFDDSTVFFIDLSNLMFLLYQTSQGAPGHPSTSANAKKCLLWDAVEERHAQEVSFFLECLLLPSTF